MRCTWRTAVPVVAAVVVAALVVTTSTKVVPGSAAAGGMPAKASPPALTMALTGAENGATLVAKATPEGRATAPDWLKPCLSQGIRVQPPNTPYPAVGSGVQLPN